MENLATNLETAMSTVINVVGEVGDLIVGNSLFIIPVAVGLLSVGVGIFKRLSH